MRDNYRVPKYQPALVSPKYSRPKLGVTSIELNLLFGMKPSQTDIGKERRDFYFYYRLYFTITAPQVMLRLVPWIMSGGEIRVKMVEKTNKELDKLGSVFMFHI